MGMVRHLRGPRLRRPLRRGALPAGALAQGLFALFLTLLGLATPASAGEIRQDGLTVVFPDGAEAEARRLLRMFPGHRRSAAHWLGLPVRGSQVRLVLVEDHRGMRRALGGPAPDWALAVTRSDDLLVFRLDRLNQGPGSRLDVVSRHEAMHQILNHLGPRLPRWFEEGLCVYHAGAAYFAPESRLDEMAAAGTLPDIDDLNGMFRRGALESAVAYEMGRALVEHLIRRFGSVAVRSIVEDVAGGLSFPDAFTSATRLTLRRFERSFREAVTPALPFFPYVLLKNLELTLLFAAAVLAFVAYVRVRRRRRRELEELDGMGGPYVPWDR